MSVKAKIILASALVTASLLMGVGGAAVFAQGPTPTPNKGARAGLAQLYLQSLASQLGTTVDKLQQAMTSARTDAINAAVKQGIITQAQADRMLQNVNKPTPTPGGKGPGFRGFAGAARGLMGPDILEALGKVLNMSPADIVTALRAGKTLADLATTQNVDPSQVQTAIANAEKAAIDRAVQVGLMTQDRANTLKAAIDPSKIDLSSSRPAFGGQRGFGVPGGFGGFGRWGGFSRPGSPTATPTP